MKHYVILFFLFLFSRTLLADEAWGVAADASKDYTTLSAAEAAKNGDLASRGVVTFEIYDLGAIEEAAAVVVTGWTNNSSTNYIRIFVPVAERGDGTKNSGARIVRTTASGNSLTIWEEYTRVIGLEIQGYASANEIVYFANLAASSTIHFSHNVIFGASTCKEGVYLGSASVKYYIWNNFITGITTASRGGIRIVSSDTSWILNNTIFNCEYGMTAAGGVDIARNNIVLGKSGSANSYQGTWDTGAGLSDYNMGDDATAPGASSIDNETAFSELADTTAADPDLHLLSTADAINAGDATVAGSGASIVTDDIDGDARSTLDIGADEFVAAPAAAGNNRVLQIIRATPPDTTWLADISDQARGGE